MYMLEKSKNTLHKGKSMNAAFMNLSKAVDTMNHDFATDS